MSKSPCQILKEAYIMRRMWLAQDTTALREAEASLATARKDGWMRQMVPNAPGQPQNERAYWLKRLEDLRGRTAKYEAETKDLAVRLREVGIDESGLPRTLVQPCKRDSGR